MGAALIVDIGSATDPGANVTACTFAAPSTNVVRNASATSKNQLVGLWRNGVTKGAVQVTSPRIVPVAHGIEFDAPAGLGSFLVPRSPAQTLTPQDTLTVGVTGGSTESDQVALQTYFADLPGVAPTLKSPGDIDGTAQFVFGWPVACEAAATVGQLGETVITTTMDSSSANAWYALLGYVVDATVTAVGISGVDTSQTFIGGPGMPVPVDTSNYFQQLSADLGLPCIPCFNAANKANTNVIVADVAASTAVNVTLVLAQMPANWTP